MAWNAVSLLWTEAPGAGREETNKLLTVVVMGAVIAATPWRPRSALVLLGAWAARSPSSPPSTLRLRALLASGDLAARGPLPGPDRLPQRQRRARRDGVLAAARAVGATGHAGARCASPPCPPPSWRCCGRCCPRAAGRCSPAAAAAGSSSPSPRSAGASCRGWRGRRRAAAVRAVAVRRLHAAREAAPDRRRGRRGRLRAWRWPACSRSAPRTRWSGSRVARRPRRGRWRALRRAAVAACLLVVLAGAVAAAASYERISDSLENRWTPSPPTRRSRTRRPARGSGR